MDILTNVYYNSNTGMNKLKNLFNYYKNIGGSMKKIFGIFIIVSIMILGVTGCGKEVVNKPIEKETENENKVSTKTDSKEESQSVLKQDDKKEINKITNIDFTDNNWENDYSMIDEFNTEIINEYNKILNYDIGKNSNPDINVWSSMHFNNIVCKVSDGGILVSGSTDVSLSSDKDLGKLINIPKDMYYDDFEGLVVPMSNVLHKMDQNGKHMWSFDQGVLIDEIVEDKAGNYTIWCQNEKDDFITVYIVNSNGELLNEKKTDVNKYEVSYIIVDNNGVNYVIDNSNCSLMKLDSNFNVESKMYIDANSVRKGMFDANNDFIYIEDANDSSLHKSIITKQSIDGKKMWQINKENVDIYDWLSTEDGIILVGLIEIEEDWNGYILKIDYKGNQIFEKNYGGTDNEYFQKVESFNDDYYIIMGDVASKDGDLTDTNKKYIYEDHFTYDTWVLAINNKGEFISNYTFDDPDSGNLIDSGVSTDEKNLLFLVDQRQDKKPTLKSYRIDY